MNEIAELCTRYRDSASPTLRVDWALLRLLDRHHCTMIEKDLAKHATPWEVYTAKERLWEMLPDKPGLYMFVWRPPFQFDVGEDRRPGDLYQVLYVGQAGAGKQQNSTLRQRYKNYSRHLRASPAQLWDHDEPIVRSKRLDRYLTLRPLEYWYTVVEDRSEIALLEDRLLQLLNPPINRDRRPKLVSRPARPAFAR